MNLNDFFAKAPAKKPAPRKPSSSAQGAKGRVASRKTAQRDDDDASSEDELLSAPKATTRKPSGSKPAAKKAAEPLDDDFPDT